MTSAPGYAHAGLLTHYLLFCLAGHSFLAAFVLPHCFVGPSLSAPYCCSGLCFGRCLLIARAITRLLALLNISEGWMVLVLGLLVGCK